MSGGVEGIHYLDDFLLFGLPESQQCAESLSRALACCDLMGIPVAPAKTEGPSTKLVFYGIEPDTDSLTLSLVYQEPSRSGATNGLVPRGSCYPLLASSSMRAVLSSRAEHSSSS